MKKKEDHKIDMRQMFLSLQKAMINDLENIRKNIDHEPTKGEGSENIWIQFLTDHLPHRYSITKAKIVDHFGNTSDAIDVVIYDRQYTPFVFNKAGIKYVPAESVYAVFEAKQKITASYLRYASNKIESVRRLSRTSAPVIDKGVKKPAPELFKILGGFICLENSWKHSISEEKSFYSYINSLEGNKSIDIGCIINDKSFANDLSKGKNEIIYSNKDETLIFFFLKLVYELQQLGTVRPIDLNQYINQLDSQ
jgi:hypothetical protein